MLSDVKHLPEQIIKRDGRIEPFIEEKVMGWGEWAAQNVRRLDWREAVRHTLSKVDKVVAAADFNKALIRTLLDMNTWPANRMAGRLYASELYKDVLGVKKGEDMPTLLAVHERMQKDGVMIHLDYTEAEYAELNKALRHDRDLKCAHYQLVQIREKYTLINRVTKEEYETNQYALMRISMFFNETRTADRIHHVKRMYEVLSRECLSAPTPNHTNAATSLAGYSSCCLYASGDNAESIAVGSHITERMTAMSAGLGEIMHVRSLKDKIRGGSIRHAGKFPYYRARAGITRSTTQGARGGAMTQYITAFDPEFDLILQLKNPRTPLDRRLRDIDYAFITNKFLVKKAALDEEVFTFNVYTAPELYKAFFHGDPMVFEREYAKHEADPEFVKNYVSAREIIISIENQGYETGRTYQAYINEINRHTPLNDPIYSSNLCLEITQHTHPYENMGELYTESDVGYIMLRTSNTKAGLVKLAAHTPVTVVEGHPKYEAGRVISAIDLVEGCVYSFKDECKRIKFDVVESVIDRKAEPEVALCSLAGIILPNIDSDALREEVYYYAYWMIDQCIYRNNYTLPHVGFVAKNRMYAGVGIMGYAHHLAKQGLNYTSPESLREHHRVAEQHMYFAIKASLRISKERGNAPWIHRTKWAEGWTPLDTYNRNVDKIVEPIYEYDWDALKAEIKANGGIAHSLLVAHMPGESSSKRSATTNSILPCRDTNLIKTDADTTMWWVAPDSDILDYQIAWEIENEDMMKVYAIFQKFADQAISADLYSELVSDAKVSTTKMMNDNIFANWAGLKTRYYNNSKTSNSVDLNNGQGIKVEAVVETDVEDDGFGDMAGVNVCGLTPGGGCSL